MTDVEGFEGQSLSHARRDSSLYTRAPFSAEEWRLPEGKREILRIAKCDINSVKEFAICFAFAKRDMLAGQAFEE